jgi:hypothetical protein
VATHAEPDNLRTLTAMIDTPVQRSESATLRSHALELRSRCVMIAGRGRHAVSADLLGVGTFDVNRLQRTELADQAHACRR